ncbi:unnamed protein product [Linum tenue]|uniref:SET domain-containing protein n=2 Tax=Linum tenue TaxID=586396 RepID=A0AAV0HR94_9ROSI|nr:unnamed protein product [Linum tenue]
MAASKLVTAASLTHCRPFTCAAAAASPYGSRLAPHPPDLIKWVKREGGFVHQAVKISHDATGFGLFASQPIPKGSQLIALPDHIPLKFASGGDGAAPSVLANLARHVPEELWAMKLGLKLLQERSQVGSFWWPYISNLPEAYSVPIFFPGEDIKNLQYAPLLHQVNKRCRFLLEFEQLVKHVLDGVETSSSDHPFGGQAVDASSLGWAMSAVSSRAFRLHGGGSHGGIDIPMMLPLIDMCNHSFNPNARIVQEQGGNDDMLINVVAETAIEEDDPLVINYGCLNNDLFLLDYGFVVPSNPYDCIELRFDGALLDAASTAAGVSSPSFSSPAPWQKEILSQLKLDGEAPVLKVTIGGQEPVEGRLLAAVRVMLTSDREMVEKHDLSTLMSLSSDSDAPLGTATEVAALRTVLALCVIALGHFPTQMMEDESLLKKGVSSATSELAIQFRIQKKALIVDVMRDLTKRVQLLSSKSKDMASPPQG